MARRESGGAGVKDDPRDDSGNSADAPGPRSDSAPPPDDPGGGDGSYAGLPDHAADDGFEDPEVTDARAAVAAAYDGREAYTRGDFEADAEAAAQALEFREPSGADRLVESHDPREQAVIDDAKAALVERQARGEVLGGDPVDRTDLWHQQGQNDRGFAQDCALVSVMETARDCAVDVSENDVVDRAVATGRCDTSHPYEERDRNGGSWGEAVHQLLSDYGIANEVVNPTDVEELARYVENGQGVIAEVNADELWDDSPFGSPGYYGEDGLAEVNHAVQVTGTVRDASGELTGFVVNDTGTEDGAGTVVPLETWDACWTNTDNDHETIVTTNPTALERAQR
jgi:hypothetical protein